VVRIVVRELVAGDAVAELALEGDAALRQQFQGPIHGCITYRWIALAHQREQLLDGDVIGVREERLHDVLALLRGAKALLRHEVVEQLAEMIPRVRGARRHRSPFACVQLSSIRPPSGSAAATRSRTPSATVAARAARG